MHGISTTKMSDDFDGKLGSGDRLSAGDAQHYLDGIERRGGATGSSWGGRGKVLTHTNTCICTAWFSVSSSDRLLKLCDAKGHLDC